MATQPKETIILEKKDINKIFAAWHNLYCGDSSNFLNQPCNLSRDEYAEAAAKFFLSLLEQIKNNN